VLRIHPRGAYEAGAFHPDKALALGVPRGPLWSVLQGGENVTLASGSVIKPEVSRASARGEKIQLCHRQPLLPRDFPRGGQLRSPDLRGHVRGRAPLLGGGKAPYDGEASRADSRDAGGVKELGLIHYSPRYADKELRLLLKEAQEVFPSTLLTADRMNFPIENID